MVRLISPCLLAILAMTNAASIVEVAFVNILSDNDIITSSVLQLIDPSRSKALDIRSIATQGLRAQRDQDAQVALLAAFAGETGAGPFLFINSTNKVIEDSYQNIISVPRPSTAQHEARIIASTRYAAATYSLYPELMVKELYARRFIDSYRPRAGVGRQWACA